MDALSSAVAGLAAASDRFTRSSVRIAGGSAELIAEIPEQIESKISFEASLAVVKTTDELSKRLLDILA